MFNHILFIRHYTFNHILLYRICIPFTLKRVPGVQSLGKDVRKLEYYYRESWDHYTQPPPPAHQILGPCTKYFYGPYSKLTIKYSPLKAIRVSRTRFQGNK